MSDEPTPAAEPTIPLPAPAGRTLDLPGGGSLALGELGPAHLEEWLEWARLRWAAQVRDGVKAALAGGQLNEAEASAIITAAFLRLPFIDRGGPEAEYIAHSTIGGHRLLWLAVRQGGYAGSFADFQKLLKE